MALDRIGWENGSLVEPAKVLADNTIQPAQYEGKTPLSAANLKKMEDNTENFVNEQVGDLNSLNTTDKSSTVGAVNEIVANLEWKLVGSVSGKSTLNLPDNFNEILVVGKYGTDYYPLIIPKILLSSSVKKINIGGRFTYSPNGGAGMNAFLTLTYYQLDYFYANGAEHSNDLTTTIYYR